MWATVRETIGYNTQGIATPVSEGVYSVGSSNEEWTSLKTTVGFVTIKTVDVLNTSESDPRDNRKPSKGGWDFGFEWQLPKLISKIADFFANLFSVSKDIFILIFWLVIAIVVVSIFWKFRPTRIKVVD